MPGEAINVTIVIPPDYAGGREAQYRVDFIRQGETLQFEAVTILQ